MPKYFGFEAAGILIKDVKANLLFTVNEIEQVIYSKEKSDFRETEKLIIPSLLGLSGLSLRHKKIYIANNIHQQPIFQCNIDN